VGAEGAPTHHSVCRPQAKRGFLGAVAPMSTEWPKVGSVLLPRLWASGRSDIHWRRDDVNIRVLVRGSYLRNGSVT
jgi:hypothetical protein